MYLNGSILTRPVALEGDVKSLHVAACLAICAGMLAGGAAAQSRGPYVPAGVEGGWRIAMDRTVTFRRPDGLVQSMLLAVPLRGRSDVMYSETLVLYDCEGRSRTLVTRSDYSRRRDPVKTNYQPEDPAAIQRGRNIQRQLEVACESRERTGTMTMFDVLGHR